MKINDFRGGLTDISAKRKHWSLSVLGRRCGLAFHTELRYIRDSLAHIFLTLEMRGEFANKQANTQAAMYAVNIRPEDAVQPQVQQNLCFQLFIGGLNALIHQS